MSRLPDLERSLTRAAERLDRGTSAPGTARRWTRWTWRLPLLAAVGTLALGGGAVAALELLPSGDPVPEAADAPRSQTIGGSERVVAARAPDPDGGPPWGIGTYRAKTSRTELECFVPGRIQGGEIGVVGRDGVFADDGRFHALQPRSSAFKLCGSVSSGGLLYLSGDGPPVPASGYTGAPGPPVGGCREDVPASTMSRQTRRRVRDIPVCDRRGLRIVKFGFAGPLAIEITYGNRRWTRTIRPARRESGAYIFVLRPRDAAGGGELTLTTTHSDGTVCTETRGSGPGGPGCLPPPGLPTGDTP